MNTLNFKQSKIWQSLILKRIWQPLLQLFLQPFSQPFLQQHNQPHLLQLIKQIKTRFQQRSIVAATCLTLAGCGAGIFFSLEPQIYSKENQIISKIGQASCTEDTQCRTFTLAPIDFCGSKRFLAYSITASNEAELQDLESERRKLIYENALLQGEIPICITGSVPTPAARCQQQRCALYYP